MIRLIPILVALPLLASVSPASTAPVTRMWQTVDTRDWAIMVRSVERIGEPVIAPDGTSVRPTGRFAVFVVDLTNRTDQPLIPQAGDFLLTGVGIPIPANLSSAPLADTLANERDSTALSAPISSGQTVHALLVYDISKDAALGTLTLHFRPAMNRPITIDECHCNLPSPSKMADAVGEQTGLDAANK